jgi:hypothetical protein
MSRNTVTTALSHISEGQCSQSVTEDENIIRTRLLSNKGLHSSDVAVVPRHGLRRAEQVRVPHLPRPTCMSDGKNASNNPNGVLGLVRDWESCSSAAIRVFVSGLSVAPSKRAISAAEVMIKEEEER